MKRVPVALKNIDLYTLPEAVRVEMLSDLVGYSDSRREARERREIYTS